MQVVDRAAAAAQVQRGPARFPAGVAHPELLRPQGSGDVEGQCLHGRVQPGAAQRANSCIRAFQQQGGRAAPLARGQVGHAVERFARVRRPGGVGNLHIWESISAHDGLRIAGLA